jgi:hypothetical protein
MGMLEYYLKDKAPFQVPEGGRKAIVQYGPWIELILLILSLPLLLLALGLTAAFLPFAAVGAPGIGLAWVALLAQIVLQVIALPGLFARKRQGWDFAFYAVGVGLISSVLYGNLLNAIVSAVIGMYILFQVRSYYT